MAKVTLNDITSGYASVTVLNQNFAAIETALENTLSRDGSTPNQMTADLDMNSNRILNLPAPGDVKEPARLQDILDASGSLNSTNASLVTAAATTNNAGVTVQAQLNNLGESTGAASVGNTPAGNISATTVQAAINELDSEKQPLDATLTALAGTLTAANKIPYATALDTAGELDFKDEDDMVSNSATAIPSQQSVKAYADNIFTVGDFSPVLNASTNLNGPAFGSPANIFYVRLKNYVVMMGKLVFESSTSGVVNFRTTIPIASNFNSLYNVFGIVNCSNGNIAEVYAKDTTDDLYWTTTANSANELMNITFAVMYKIL